MIRPSFTEPADNPDWARWRKKAQDRTDKLVEKYRAGDSYRISEALYKEMRQVFLDAFHGKCAYCEAKLILDQHQGDVEHYRPKGRVTDEAGRVVTTPGPSGQPEPHRGYPWLAYDWRNLLPSCAACNQPGKTRQGRRVGKWDQFPVGRFRATVPGDEARERPRLLHPLFDDPEKHLVLDPERGILAPQTARGRVSVELLDLNREGLPEERLDVYTKVRALVHAARDALDEGELDAARKYLAALQRYRDGSAPWSWAGRLALDALGSLGR